MQMHDLRCKTPDLVRKEIWTHVLAYNLIRTVMAQAAATHDLVPRSISFKGTMQTLEAFQPVIELQTARARHIACGFTKNYSVPAQLIAWLTDPIVSNRD
jgi:hypothetical protein